MNNTITLNCSALDLLTLLEVFRTHQKPLLDLSLEELERIVRAVEAGHEAINAELRKENA